MKKPNVWILAAVLLLICVVGVHAGPIDAGLDKAASEVKNTFKSLTKLMFYVCAAVGVVSAIQVFSKMSSGDPDTRKAAGSWVGALIFAAVSVLVLEAVFM
jgi:hypothetical protein